MLPHDSTPYHISLLFLNFLTQVEISHSTTTVAPADFFLFLKWKSTLKGWRFDAIQEIKFAEGLEDSAETIVRGLLR